MKNRIVATLLLSTLILAGCQGKGIQDSNNNANQSVNSSSNGTKAAGTDTSNTSSDALNKKTDDTQYNFKPVKPGTIPQLNENQKAQIKSKLEPAMNNVENSLKSLQDVKDIDLSSLN